MMSVECRKIVLSVCVCVCVLLVSISSIVRSVRVCLSTSERSSIQNVPMHAMLLPFAGDEKSEGEGEDAEMHACFVCFFSLLLWSNLVESYCHWPPYPYSYPCLRRSIYHPTAHVDRDCTQTHQRLRRLLPTEAPETLDRLLLSSSLMRLLGSSRLTSLPPSSAA